MMAWTGTITATWEARCASALAMTMCAVPVLAQSGEARCSLAASPQAFYILRVPAPNNQTVLRTFPAADVVEVGRGSEICAGTPTETCTWLATLRASRPQLLTDLRQRLEERRVAIRAGQQLLRDVQTLREGLNASYSESEADIKDSIKFSLTLVVSAGGVAEGVWDATRDLALSRAIGDDALSFGADASLIIKKNGATGKAVRKLGTLTALETISLAGADVIATNWLKPARDRINQTLAQTSEAGRAAVLKEAEGTVATTVLGAALLKATVRDIARAERYAAVTGAACGR